MAPVLACVSRTLSLSWRKAVLSIEGGQKRWLSQLRQILTDFENIFIGSHLAVNLQICHTSSIFCCTTLWLGLINLFFFHFVFINKYCVFSLGVFSWWASFKPATENKWNVAVKKSYETWWQHVFWPPCMFIVAETVDMWLRMMLCAAERKSILLKLNLNAMAKAKPCPLKNNKGGAKPCVSRNFFACRIINAWNSLPTAVCKQVNK